MGLVVRVASTSPPWFLLNGTFLRRRAARIGQGQGIRAAKRFGHANSGQNPDPGYLENSRDRGLPGKML